ncbi:uncharacterized protein SCODWIG_02491 [Saccharomycodes ludwigii]|uniref:SUR7 family protein FMP45 n=1 Tax=Saccharomycodes ludwigii TaxID=36035 RepID=A0A376B9C9_9ASCO|nr:uncharacterized protein SCODWIG_02491 [Saccharomycodes ludwigii]
MGIKKFVHFLILFFILGAGLLTFFTILSGGRSSGTLGKFYWLEADTQNIGNAQNTTRWTNYMSCGYTNGNYHDCSSRMAGYPFSPRDNFNTSANLPSTFVRHRKTYYYLSRVGWAMLLIGLFFILCTLIPSVLALCFSIPSVLVCSSVFVWLSWFFITLAACLLTACYVKGRNAFQNDNRHAKLGVKNFAFIWTTVALLTISAFWYPVSTIIAKGQRQGYIYGNKKNTQAQNYDYETSSSENNEKFTNDANSSGYPLVENLQDNQIANNNNNTANINQQPANPNTRTSAGKIAFQKTNRDPEVIKKTNMMSSKNTDNSGAIINDEQNPRVITTYNNEKQKSSDSNKKSFLQNASHNKDTS